MSMLVSTSLRNGFVRIFLDSQKTDIKDIDAQIEAEAEAQPDDNEEF